MSFSSESNKKRKIDNVSNEGSISDDELLLQHFTEKRTVSKDSWEDTLYKIISDLEEKTNVYLDSEAIINDFKNSLLSNKEGMMNRCLECGIDMGRCNPRQLCGKTYCYSNE